MANQITVNTKEVSNKATELKKFNSDLKKRIEELRTQEQALNKMWDGDANDAFHAAFTKDVTQMNNFYNAIEKYVSNLNEIVKKYEAAESKNLQTAKERKY